MSGAAANIDLSGLSLLSALGQQTVLRYSGNGSAINTVTTAGLTTSSSLSSFSIQPYTSTSDSSYTLTELPLCAPALVKYHSPPLICPDGSASVQYGWSSERWNPLIRYGTPWAYYAQLMGNTVHFFPFTSQLPGSVVHELTVMLYDAPGKVLRMRLGLFTAANNSGPFTLLQQTAELTLLNPAGGLISAALLSPVTLTASTYYIGLWADQAVRTPYLLWSFGPVGALGYDSLGAGQFPSSIPLSRLSSYGRLLGARSCVPEQKVEQYAFCATFFHARSVVTYSGVLDVLANPYSNAQGQYRIVVAANGTRIVRTGAVETSSPLTLGGWGTATNNFLYQAGNSGFAVDMSGLQFLVGSSSSSKEGDILAVILNLRNVTGLGQAPQLSYQETELDSSSYIAPVVVSNLNASFLAQPGVDLPSCSATAPSSTPYSPPLNLVVPASVSRLSCDSRQDKVAVNFGDQYIADYANRASGASLPGNTVYTLPFTSIAGASLLQLSVAVLNNELTSAPIAIRLGVYSAATLQLLSQTPETVLYQVRDQVVTVNLTASMLLPDAALYWLALVSNSSLALATSNTSSPSMALQYTAAGLSPNFVVASTLSASPALAGSGCAFASHSFCAYFQYYQPTPYKATETYVYQGLLTVDSAAAYTTRFGVALPVLGGSGYMNMFRIYQAVSIRSFQSYILALRAANAVYLQPSSAAVVDASGLQLLINGGKSSVRLSYSANISAIVESVRGDLVFSSITVTALNTSSGLPGCSITEVPNYQLGVSAAAPSCPVASSLVTYGDATPSDLQYQRGSNALWQLSSSLRRFRSSSSNYTQLQWLSFGVQSNPGSLLRITLNLWSLQLQIIGSTARFSAANTREQTLVAPLLSPLLLSPDTEYYVNAVISDYVNSPAAATYGPEVGTGSYAGLIRALGASGCLTGPPKPQSSSSSSSSSPRSSSAALSTASSFSASSGSSTDGGSSSSGSDSSTSAAHDSSGGSSAVPWSSSGAATMSSSVSSSSSASAAVEPSSASGGSSWSDGEVVGVALGCVVGSNALLLLLLWACFARRAGSWQRFKSNSSRRDSGLYHAEQSRGSSRAEHEHSQVEFNVR